MQKQRKPCLHWAASRLGQNEMPFGKRFKLVRRHERPAHHLQALTRIVLSSGDGAGQHGAVAKCLRQNLRAFRIGCEATEQDILAVVNDDAGAFLAIVFLQLGKGLDDRHHTDAPGTPCGEHHLHGFNLWDCADLIRKHHHTVWKFSAMLIRNGQHFPIELLKEQGHHKVLRIIFFWKHNKNS